jgi:hypothetical protein
MFFKKKVYDDEAEKARMKGLQSKLKSESLIQKRKKLEEKFKMAKKQNSVFSSPTAKALNAKVGKIFKKRFSPSQKSSQKNPLDDFFK